MFNGYWTVVDGKSGIMSKNNRFYPIDVILKSVKRKVKVKLCCTCMETFKHDAPICGVHGIEVVDTFFCEEWKPVTAWHKIKRRFMVLFSVCPGDEGCHSRIRCKGCNKI